MGEGEKPLFEPSFNRAVKVHGGQDRLTSDAGTLLLREADHRLSLTQSLAAQLYDRRNSDRTRYTLVELLRERLYALAQGYDAQDDVDELGPRSGHADGHMGSARQACAGGAGCEPAHPVALVDSVGELQAEYRATS